MPQKYRLPDDLYQYQKEDSEKMGQGGNWLNFSEMGVGKTPEAIQVVEGGGYKLPLIVCPNSLRYEWARQIEEWTDQQAAVSSPDPYLRLEPIYRSFLQGETKKYRIINYETLRKPEHRELLQAIPWDIIIFDEIHKLRNPDTKLTKGTWEFLNYYLEKTQKIIGLSGSPIMNYPPDLYVPLSIVNPKKYTRRKLEWKYFMYKYSLFAQGRYGNYIYGARHMQELRDETSPYIIRRTKKEVLPFLPDKYYRRPLLDMEPDQRKLYDQMVNELRVMLDTGEPLWSPNVLSLLTRLRQINLDPRIVGITSSSVKTDFLLEFIESTDEKVVVFSCFEKYIYLLSTVFLTNIKHVVVTGATKPEDRSAQVKKFQEDPDTKLFLGTIQTAGEGITLTSSSNVLLMDRWWNEPTNQQAIDRLHRIGQKNAVQVILPICSKSVDAIVDEILDRKHGMSQDFYSEGQIRDSVLSTLTDTL